jgi:hypothetical protein
MKECAIINIKKEKKIAIKNKKLIENQTIDNTKDSLIENSH